MLETFYNRLKVPQRFMTLELWGNSLDTGLVYQELRYSSDDLESVSTKEVSDVKDLPPSLKDKAVIVVLHLEHILFRVVETSQAEEFIPENHLMGIDTADFFIQYIPLADSNRYGIAFLRRDEVEEQLQKLQTYKIAPIQVTLAIPPFIGLLQKEKAISASIRGISLDFSQANPFVKLADWSLPQKDIDLVALSLTPLEILGFCATADYLMKETQLKGYSKEVNLGLHQRYTRKRFYRNGLYWGLGMILMVLVVNTVFFFYYQGRIDPLVSVSFSDNLGSTVELIDEIEQKKAVLNHLMPNYSVPHSYLLDRMAVSLPPTLTLTSLQYDTDPKSSPSSKYVLEGVARDYKALLNWLQTIESWGPVRECTLVQYEQDRKGRNVFLIQILVRS